jgi:ABC-type molybdate transport system permease subunit
MWSDVQCYGNRASFASPSGHVLDASFIVFFFICDTFFASNFARQRNPSSNAFSLSENLPVFLTSTVLGAFFIYVVMRNRLFLGAHTFDQVLLGL